jgi:glyoxylase-like metal-dependent hydrolase (beta-lactamase superfamily II)
MGGRVKSVPRCHKLKGMATGNIYIIEDDELVLVDTGAPVDSRLVVRKIESLGRDAGDIGHVFITHFHVDHAGAASALKRISGARVYAHRDDASYLDGSDSTPSVFRKGVIGRGLSMASTLSERATAVPPVEVDVRLDDGDMVPVLGGLRVIHAPGHTPGNSCYLWEDEGILFSGDAIINTYHVLTLPTIGFSYDFEQAAKSACGVVDRVALDELRLVCPGHGPVVSEKVGERLERFRKRTSKRL